MHDMHSETYPRTNVSDIRNNENSNDRRVKISRCIPGPGNFNGSIPAATLLDFTGITYVPGPSKFATFAIVSR